MVRRMCGEYALPADHDLRPDHERLLLVNHVEVHSSFRRSVSCTICATF
jgi:hypothetical protein